ncbi:MAG TPA: hypothetical protein PK037_01930 [Saprospiraceae bacterium]|nr:hypothetical protein [Saprospiraceae bacterium]
MALSQSLHWNQDTKYIYAGSNSYYKEGQQTNLATDGWKNVDSDHVKLSPDQWHSIKFSIINKDANDRSLVLFLHNAQLDSVYYILYQSDNVVVASPLTGCNMPIERRPTGNRTLSLPLLLKSRQVYTLVLHVYGREFEIAVTPQLIDPLYDNDFEWTDSAYFVLFILIAICLFISVTLYYYLWKYNQRTITFGWFIVYAIFGAFHLIATSGYGSLFIWGAFPFVEVNAAIFTGAVCCLALLEMAGSAMRTSSKYTLYAKYLRYFGLFYLISAFIGFGHYFSFWPAGYYKALISVSYVGMILAHAVIAFYFLFSKEYTFNKGRYWIGLFYLLHLFFYLAIICVENNYVLYNHKLHTFINLVFYIPQMVLVIFYLILNYIAIMEKMRKEEMLLRDNILTKLYTEVSEPLSKINLSLFVRPGYDEINDFSVRILKINSDVQLARRQLNDLYSAMKPGVAHVSDLFNDLKEWISEFWKDTSMKIETVLELKHSNLELDPLVKAQLTFIIKEINNNIAKHAHASFLHFKIEENGYSRFNILISDNGVGFSQSEISQGHGLSGIKARIEKIGGTLEMISKPGEGVHYRLCCRNRIL